MSGKQQGGIQAEEARRVSGTTACRRGPSPPDDFGVYLGLGPHSPHSAESRQGGLRKQARWCGTELNSRTISELSHGGTPVLGDCSQGTARAIAMSTGSVEMREILHEEWLGFLDAFSHRHQSGLVGLEVSSPRVGILVVTANRALEAIGIESADGHERVVICLSGHLTYFVSKPKRVLLHTTQSGMDRGLEIESANGTTTAVRFCNPMRPDPALN